MESPRHWREPRADAPARGAYRLQGAVPASRNKSSATKVFTSGSDHCEGEKPSFTYLPECTLIIVCQQPRAELLALAAVGWFRLSR